MSSVSSQDRATSSTNQDDDILLQEMGYVPSFKREFTSLSTISFAFSIMGLCSSIATTFSPAAVRRARLRDMVLASWLLHVPNARHGASVAEIVGAFPTCGGMYMASAQLAPLRYRAIVGWIVGWLSVLGIIFALSSVEFGLPNMIWAAVVIAKDGDYVLSSGKSVGLCTGLLVIHGILNCLPTRSLSRLNSGFVFINLGATILTIIVLLAMTPRSEMHSAAFVFGPEGVINNAQGWTTGVAFLFGLLSA
ncbi:hypothetical protein PHLGIDRAFT_122382 [Phlebiopsis gigantea 11061_1 CR5-6]|uniref:Amino acid permease/ SLC12A domain-containing protein n=1 Tax=Phlebiopsis gigantea (strain 11061_1 CR5-6) TaxID=745531 RepID=A0A0C3S3Q2_PHLG1|nr:hypothetical protein PHLGIDRAFT_122382 [Phlebiopsis gigantea 11061_1 CR5-6]